MIDEVQGMKARLDGLELLVGTARPALQHALAQPDEQQLRREVQAVVNALRDYEPKR